MKVFASRDLHDVNKCGDLKTFGGCRHPKLKSQSSGELHVNNSPILGEHSIKVTVQMRE